MEASLWNERVQTFPIHEEKEVRIFNHVVIICPLQDRVDRSGLEMYVLRRERQIILVSVFWIALVLYPGAQTAQRQ